MNMRRILIIAGVVLVVGGLIAGAALWAVDEPRDAPTTLSDAVLVAEDFTPDYVLDEIDYSDGGTPPGNDVAPQSCEQVLRDQARRNEGAKVANMQVTSGVDGKPRFTQTVISQGESVEDALSVVSQCPTYSYETSDGTSTRRLSVTQAVVATPADCDADARYVRRTLGVEGSTPAGDPARSITAYLQGGSLSSALTRTGYGEPDSEFCRLVGRAADRLYGRDG
ncbi:hypothetical protein GCM10009624_25110 [Gordonia sinesedis]